MPLKNPFPPPLLFWYVPLPPSLGFRLLFIILTASVSLSLQVPSLSVSNPDLIYDMTWFPLMTSTSSSSSVCLVSCGRNPLRLIDAYTGKTRATYKAFDHLEQMVSPHSIAFSPDGEKIYAGFTGILRVFYTSVPGSSFIEVPTASDAYLQTGILSCIAFNPGDKKMFAVGSYSKQISLSNERDEAVFHVLGGQSKGGVTHLAFSQDGNKLLSGGRKDPNIICWDLRNLGQVFCVYKRSVSTNQRMYFDVKNDMLFSGNDNGLISLWSLSSPETSPSQSFKGHNDSVNGISLHPCLPLLASVSGSRKFPELTSDDEDEQLFSKRYSAQSDNSLKVWHLTHDHLF